MNPGLSKRFGGLLFKKHCPQSATPPKRPTIPHRKANEAPARADVAAVTRANKRWASRESASRHIDWYVNGRGLPPQIAVFLDTHWRSYVLRLLSVDGDNSQSCNEAFKTMKELAWSVRPKQDPLSRSRLIRVIPLLYERLHDGLESLGMRAAHREAFFAALTKLHQEALNPQVSAVRVSAPSGTRRRE